MRSLVSNSIYATKDRNGPPSANQLVSIAEHSRSHAACTHPSPLSAEADIMKLSLMMLIGTIGPKGLT